MKNDKNLLEDLSENKAVQVGAGTAAAAGMAHIGVSTIGLSALSTTGFGAGLLALGPIGLAVGGVILVGGIASTISKRSK